jgi:galactokinase/mevalonate kinase-like predicted kinase
VLSYSRTEEVEAASQLQHPIVREGLGMLGLQGGLEITSGGGGFLLFYAPPEKHDAITSALSDLRRIPFSMEPRGSRIIFVNQ